MSESGVAVGDVRREEALNPRPAQIDQQWRAATPVHRDGASGDGASGEEGPVVTERAGPFFPIPLR